MQCPLRSRSQPWGSQHAQHEGEQQGGDILGRWLGMTPSMLCRNTWTELKPEGLRPKARYAHSLTSCNGRVYLFGGESNTSAHHALAPDCSGQNQPVHMIGCLCAQSNHRSAARMTVPVGCSFAGGCLDTERPRLKGVLICGMGPAGAPGAGPHSTKRRSHSRYGALLVQLAKGVKAIKW